MQALQEQVAGREYAVAALARAVTLALADGRHSNSNYPLAVLLFAGPTSSGNSNIFPPNQMGMALDERFFSHRHRRRQRFIPSSCFIVGRSCRDRSGVFVHSRAYDLHPARESKD